MVENARQERDNALKCLLDCLISCLDSLAQYLNRWAYTYIGIYGHSFVEAGHKVYNLFVRRGLTALLNDNLVGRVLFLGALMVGLVTCGLGVLLAFILQHSYLKDVENAPSLLGGAGFVVGFFVTDVMMNVVSAAVAAVLVCFLEDSQALAITHPDYHSYLVAAWAMRFPDINW
ncbi:Choline transporter [Nannochloropsis gaditana]|nr:Choline transporter [Nannochloropsis gaditana]